MALASVPIAAETVAVLPAAVITLGAGCFAAATLIGSAASAFEKAANSAGGAAAGAGLDNRHGRLHRSAQRSPVCQGDAGYLHCPLASLIDIALHRPRGELTRTW